MFEYSDLRANYPTHGMLALSKIYAVKTGHPLKFCEPANIRNFGETGDVSRETGVGSREEILPIAVCRLPITT